MSFLKKLLDGIEVKWQPLSEITLRTNNIKWRDTTDSYRYIDLTSVDIETKKIIETSVVTSNNAPSRAQKLIEKDDVIFATTRPTQMRYCLIDEEYDGEVASTGYCVLRAKKEVILPKWILHLISSSEFKGYLEENQTEIVRILDTFSAMTAELTAELSTRKKQYNYYHDQLLSFKDGEVEWSALGDIGAFTYGYAAKAQDFGDARFVRITDINANGKLILEEAKYVDISDENEKYLLNKNDLLMARTGATFGKTMIFEEDYPAIYAGFLIKLSLDEKIVNPKYYWHFAQSDLFWDQANKLVSGGGQPQFNANALKQVKMPLPYPQDNNKSLIEQARIVSILDKFDAITSSIREGLPREIELRQQQYEYYRDLLFSFPKSEEIEA